MAERDVCYRCWPGEPTRDTSKCPHCAQLNGENALAIILELDNLREELEHYINIHETATKKQHELRQRIAALEAEL